MTISYGRPTAEELVAAVAEFLESDVRGATDGQVNFHARVAANVLRIVERQLGSNTTGAVDEQDLVTAIRDGEVDGRSDEVMAALRTLVYDRLAVAHPDYAITSIADRLFAAIEAGDIETVAAMWSDDITVWHMGAARPRDKARALKVIDWFISVTADRTYDVLSRDVFANGFVQQHVLHGTARDGTPYDMRVGIIFKVGPDGLITAIDEYFDPAALESLNRQTRS